MKNLQVKRGMHTNFFNDYEIEFGHSPLKGIWPSVNDGGRCKNSCKGSPSCKNRCKGTPSCKNNCKGGPHHLCRMILRVLVPKEFACGGLSDCLGCLVFRW